MLPLLPGRIFPGVGRPIWRWFLLLRCILLLAVVVSVPRLSAQRPSAAGIELRGRLVDSRSGEGLASAKVIVLALEDEEILAEIDTGPEGNFVLRGLEKGHYRIRATKRGFADLLPEKSSARTINIPGSEEQPLTIALVPTGVITGRVMDPVGQPIRNAMATALVRRAGAEGVRLLPQGSPVLVDDRGEYRLYDLPPGRYTVVAASSGRSSGSAFAPVYFPGTYDATRAGFFPVEGATERRGTDLLVPGTGLYHLRGMVTGQRTTGASDKGDTAVTLVPASGAGLPFGMVNADSEARFQFSGVPPGAYYAIALSPVIGRSAMGPIPGAQAMQGIAQVEIGPRDVSDAIIVLRPGFAIAGQVRFSHPGRANQACLRSATVALYSVNPIQPGPPLTAKVTPSGQFKFQDVFEGNYRISLRTEGGGCSLERVTLGGHTMDGAIVTLDGTRGQEQLVLWLTAEGGSVVGTVADADGVHAGGALVLIMPEALAARAYSEGIQSAAAGSDGRFEFRQLPPGQYVLLAVQSIRSNELLDPLFWSEQQLDTVGVVVKGGGEIEVALRISQ